MPSVGECHLSATRDGSPRRSSSCGCQNGGYNHARDLGNGACPQIGSTSLARDVEEDLTAGRLDVREDDDALPIQSLRCECEVLSDGDRLEGLSLRPAIAAEREYARVGVRRRWWVRQRRGAPQHRSEE